jgi:hypothetical protein
MAEGSGDTTGTMSTVRLEEAKLVPRSGVAGLWDRLIGPGATSAENALIIFWMLLCATAVVTYALVANLDCSALHDRERAVFYARCKLLEDVAYGLRTPGARCYAEAGLVHLDRSFKASP